MKKSKLATTLVAIVMLIPLSGCGVTANQAGRGPTSGSSMQSGQQSSDPQTQLLKVREIVGTKWKAKDGTEYEFSDKPSPKINGGKDAAFVSGFPKAIAKDHQTPVYALCQNGKPMDGNNGSGMWYAVTDYFPVDMGQSGGNWNVDASGALLLVLMTDNNGGSYKVTATKDEMKLAILSGKNNRDGDTTFYYPFEPLQNDAQLNNGVGVLERVK